MTQQQGDTLECESADSGDSTPVANRASLPDFVILGAMKCATSTLHDQLARQPGIFMSTPKEPNFFSDDDVFARGQDWYESLFAVRGSAELAGESSTHYSKLPTHPNTLERLAPVLPNARFVYVMRHPVDRLVSQYVHEWTMNTVDGSLDDIAATHPGLVDYSCYSRQLEPWLRHYGPDRILPVFFDRLTAEPQATLEEVCAFLGYSGQPKWQTEVPAQNVSKERLRRSAVLNVLVWNPVATWIRRTFVPSALRDRVKSRYQMRERPTISGLVRANLEQCFDEDLARLGSWLGRDLRCANWRTVALQPAPGFSGWKP